MLLLFFYNCDSSLNCNIERWSEFACNETYCKSYDDACFLFFFFTFYQYRVSYHRFISQEIRCIVCIISILHILHGIDILNFFFWRYNYLNIMYFAGTWYTYISVCCAELWIFAWNANIFSVGELIEFCKLIQV